MVLPRISGGGGGQLTIQGKIHPKIHLRAQRLAVLGVAAEGLGSLICLWIFRYFSSLSFAKISSSPVGLEPAARAELSRFARSCCTFSLAPLPPPLNLPRAPGSEASRRPIDLGGSEGGRYHPSLFLSVPYCLECRCDSSIHGSHVVQMRTATP